jgi:uncharacterized SAM-binding protein YcdF (DUF218 family)
MQKKIVRILATVIGTLILTVGLIAFRIYSYSTTVSDQPADAAIVLGAAVWGDDVSPVFKERINHAVELRRSGKVRKIIFTGGQGNRNEPTEAAAARQYAIDQGISPADILLEEKSHTTYENLLFAREVVVARGLKGVLIVSDPLHMKRAVTIALDLGLDAYPSHTPTTRYEGRAKQLGLLAHETYYYIGYLIRRPFIKYATAQPHSDYALRIGALLPGNWDLTESSDEILIIRKDPVRGYSCMGIDLALLMHRDLLKEDVEKNGTDQAYKIRLRFAPKIQVQEYARLKEANERIKVSKSTMISNREFFEDDAMKSFDPRYQELPEYYDEHSSVYVETTMFPWDCVYPDEVAIECENTLKALDSLFQRYSSFDHSRTLHRGGPELPPPNPVSVEPP